MNNYGACVRYLFSVDEETLEFGGIWGVGFLIFTLFF